MIAQPVDTRQLSMRRSLLHRAGAISEAIAVQIEIHRLLEEQGGSANQIAGSHNYLSVLYTKLKDYLRAETHARRALDLHEGGTTPKAHASLACYSMMLARILCLLGHRLEALQHAEIALKEWRFAHPPPASSSDFLQLMEDEVAEMKAGTWKNPITSQKSLPSAS